MAKLRSLSTDFWTDPFIEELIPKEKLLFIYLITNEKTNMLGIYEVSIKKISYDTGLTKEEINKALKGFETVKKVKYINNYVILVNFLKHQNFNTNMKKSAIDTYNNLPKELKDNNINISKDNPLKGFETLLNHYGMVRKREVEHEDEIESKEEVKENSDNFYNIEKLLNYYINKKQLVKAVLGNKKLNFKNKEHLIKRLNEFNTEMESQSTFQKQWGDYTSHFLNWHRKKKEIEIVESSNKCEIPIG